MSYPSLDYTFEQYAKDLTTARTKGYPMCGNNMVYPALKCAGEAGELADKIGKHWRNETKSLFENGYSQTNIEHGKISVPVFCMSAQSMSTELKIEIQKEMGDVLWYLWAMCEEMGIPLEQVAKLNVIKVSDRAKRGVVCSEGDNR
jgi:NTP pyrophosphatase (non-canonical NTP hydrolase)